MISLLSTQKTPFLHHFLHASIETNPEKVAADFWGTKVFFGEQPLKYVSLKACFFNKLAVRFVSNLTAVLPWKM
jgi:hypothetical protein